MKRFTCLLILISVLLNYNSYAQNKMIDGGFSVKFSFGFPPTTYGFEGDLPLPEDLQVKTTFGLEIGNQWYFLKKDHFGLGLDVNWFELIYSKAKMEDQLFGTRNRITMEGSFLEFGPVATYAINDLFAIEGYYNLRPSYMATYYYENSDDYVLWYNFNWLHAIGLGVRVKFIYIGYERTFGNVDGKLTGGGEYEDVGDLYDNQPMNGGNSKLIIGFQF